MTFRTSFWWALASKMNVEFVVLCTALSTWRSTVWSERWLSICRDLAINHCCDAIVLVVYRCPDEAQPAGSTPWGQVSKLVWWILTEGILELVYTGARRPMTQQPFGSTLSSFQSMPKSVKLSIFRDSAINHRCYGTIVLVTPPASTDIFRQPATTDRLGSKKFRFIGATTTHAQVTEAVNARVISKDHTEGNGFDSRSVQQLFVREISSTPCR